jgi:RNA polymerase sigma factor (sigma-70 family)
VVGFPGPGFAAGAGSWLASPALDRVVARIASQYHLMPDDLPDLVQETRIALWEKGLETPVSAALVVKIASNRAVDLIRRRLRRRTRDRAAAIATLPPEENVELRHLLNARVEALPPRLHRFYELHYHQGLREREIASMLGLCRSSVRWLDHQVRRFVSGGSPTPIARRRR